MENDKKIKLFWDFRNQVALQTAERHKEHLDEFIEAKNIVATTGFEQINEFYAFTYLISSAENLDFLKERLKPNRGELLL